MIRLPSCSSCTEPQLQQAACTLWRNMGSAPVVLRHSNCLSSMVEPVYERSGRERPAEESGDGGRIFFLREVCGADMGRERPFLPSTASFASPAGLQLSQHDSVFRP